MSYITSPTKFEFAGEMIEGEKKGKDKGKEGMGEYPSLTQEQISKEKRLFLLPFLRDSFLILFFSNNETSGKDVEFFHRAKR